ncbi:MAG: 50S ribosomal protein L7/L12 [Candidatus Parcubacteria bacterium]|nr:MAG: 50S ribosomal protein L7/L12 [Candidatus Parcubacteria bacterium]
MAEKIQKIIDEISNLTVLELNELVKLLEDKFGVQAVAFQVPTQAKSEAPVEEGSANVDIILADAGSQKLNVIKIIREINPNLSLKEAKDIVDNPPQKIAEKVERKKAEEWLKKFQEAGAKVELK